MTHAHLVAVSGNQKTGPIPVTTTERATCPPSCPLRGAGCYADSGPLAMHWSAVSRHERGLSWSALCDAIRQLPRGQVWRHNQAGDLPGKGGRINRRELSDLVDANRGRRGFAYTHKPLTAVNLAAVRDANERGFAVNLSANSPREADTLAELGVPVVSVAPIDAPRKIRLPSGRVSVGCPAAYREDVSCATCGGGEPLCARRDRAFVIHFPAHGTAKKRADAIARA